MAEKSRDLRLIKLVSKNAASRNLTMGYLFYKFEIVKTKSDVTYNISFLPLVSNVAAEAPEETEGENKQETKQEEPEMISKVHDANDSEFSRDNRLSAVADLMTNTIRFPHISKFSLETAYRGYGLGAYAMNELVTNLKANFPEFKIEPVAFYFDHKREGEDRDAFFRFMEKFGFWFSFDDENNNKGLLNLEKAEMLKNTVRKDTCVELEIAPFVRSVFKERDFYRQELGRVKFEYKKNNTYLNRFQKDETIKFLINVIIALCIVILLVLFI